MSLLTNLLYRAPSPSRRALRLHRTAPVADLHVDTLLAHTLTGYDATKRHKPWIPFSPLLNQVDLPRARDAGVKILGMGLVSSPKHAPKKRLAQVDKQLDYVDELAGNSDNGFYRIGDFASLTTGLNEQKIGALPGVEGAHVLGGDMGVFRHLVSRGIRYFGLSHFSTNEAAYCAFGLNASETEGLTDFGRKLVERCEQEHLILDLAHINKPGFLDVCAMLSTPPIVSHTGVTGVCDHWRKRNIDDEQIEAVAKLGGVVGIMFSPDFCGNSNFATLEVIADSIEHVAKGVGYRHVAIGSDMDGWLLTLPRGLADVSDLPNLTEILIRRGWTDEQLTALLGGNVLRVLHTVLPEGKPS